MVIITPSTADERHVPADRTFGNLARLTHLQIEQFHILLSLEFPAPR